MGEGCEVLLEDNRLVGEPIDVGRRFPRISVAAEVIRPGRVEDADDDVRARGWRGRPRFPRLLGLL
jgi:hypothetical protein